MAASPETLETFRRFAAADHVFMDSLGNRTIGAMSMEAGWRGYLALCPDYWIRIDH